MPKKYRIRLTESEREQLEAITRKQRVAASKKQRAGVFLLCDENRSDGPLKDVVIAERVGLVVSSIERLRKQCHEQGPLKALERKKRTTSPTPAIVDGELEAKITALACSPAPEGRVRWTLQMLADRVVELDLVESISYQTIRRTLKKTNCSLTGKNIGASPKKKVPLS